MYQLLRQTYRHFVQQQSVRQIMAPQNARGANWGNKGWETGGILALFSAAAVCGTLAQLHCG